MKKRDGHKMGRRPEGRGARMLAIKKRPVVKGEHPGGTNKREFWTFCSVKKSEKEKARMKNRDDFKTLA